MGTVTNVSGYWKFTHPVRLIQTNNNQTDIFKDYAKRMETDKGV